MSRRWISYYNDSFKVLELNINILGNCLITHRKSNKLNMTILYDYGDKCTSVTGGWTAYSSSGNYEEGTNYLKFGKFSQGVGTGGYQTTNNINLTGYNYLWFEGYMTTNEGGGSSYAYFKMLSGTTEICNACVMCPHYDIMKMLIPISSTSNNILKVQGSSAYQYTMLTIFLYKLGLVRNFEA